jgi:hypothetical protein
MDPVRTLDAVMCNPNRANAVTRAIPIKIIANAHCTLIASRIERGSDICADAVVADMDELSGNRTFRLAMHPAQLPLRLVAEPRLAIRD